MTVERLNLKQAAAKYGVGRRSQARHRLADLNAQAAKLTDRQTKLETRVRKAEACRAAVAGAEAELRGALFEAEVDGSPLPKARLAQLRQAITDARAGATDTAEAETEIAGVLGDYAKVEAEREAVLVQIVSEEAAQLAAGYHRAAALALRAEASIKGLALWANYITDNRMLGGQLQALTRADTNGDPATLKADLDAHEAAWRDTPARILTNPDATGPEPTADVESAHHAA